MVSINSSINNKISFSILLPYRNTLKLVYCWCYMCFFVLGKGLSELLIGHIDTIYTMQLSFICFNDEQGCMCINFVALCYLRFVSSEIDIV
jgi:hypothetical protein